MGRGDPLRRHIHREKGQGRGGEAEGGGGADGRGRQSGGGEVGGGGGSFSAEEAEEDLSWGPVHHIYRRGRQSRTCIVARFYRGRLRLSRHES